MPFDAPSLPRRPPSIERPVRPLGLLGVEVLAVIQ